MPVAPSSLLPNLVWHSLTGPHARHARSSASAGCYAPGLPPLAGFATPARPDWHALAAQCQPGERLVVVGAAGPVPAPWLQESEATAVQLAWDAPPPAFDVGFETVRLGPSHVAQMLELVAATQPGPFGPRSIELGSFHGVFAHGRLVAMAGERMHAGALREISGVCTQAAWQGRGLGRRLIERLVHDQLLRGETPCLHAMSEHAGALRLYRRIGFRPQGQVRVQAVSLAGSRRTAHADGLRADTSPPSSIDA